MINERVGIEDAFAMVVEAVLSNTHCGSTLIRKPKNSFFLSIRKDINSEAEASIILNNTFPICRTI